MLPHPAKREVRGAVSHEHLPSLAYPLWRALKGCRLGASSQHQRQEDDMTLDPFLTATPHLQVHIVSALIGLTLGPIVLYHPRRDRLHKVLGYVWVTAMAAVAISAFWIEAFWSPFYFGPLHGFALLTLWSLWHGVRAAVARDFKTHRAVFRSLYSNGLIIAGTLTFLPGRTINHIVFEERAELGWVVIAALLAWVLYRLAAPRLRSGLPT
jgi:uncharacterized membrane protein